MRVYIVSQKELDSLRETLRLSWLEHCDRFGLRPSLVNDPNHHDYALFASFNYNFCRWRSDVMGDDYPKDLRPEENDRLARKEGESNADYIARLLRLAGSR